MKAKEIIDMKLPSNAIICIVGTWCNLRCPYCFHHKKNQENRQLMSQDLLERFIREYLELPLPLFIFNWHGGEPLLAGLPFFEQIVRIQKRFRKKGQIIQNLVQTNGTLLNEEWALFFKDHNFGVGVSMDGIEEIHDCFRKDGNDRGSFKRVIEGVEALRKHGVEPGILQTLTRDNISKGRNRENFRFFFRDLEIKSLALNPLFFSQRGARLSSQSIRNREFTLVLKDYIDLWLAEDDGDIQIREIDNLLGALLNHPIHHCDFNGLCWTTFCLDYNGKIYFCDRFLRQKRFLCGDLSRQSLSEVFASSAWQSIVKAAGILPPACKNCEWRDVCHNGCSHLRVGGVGGRYYYCPTRKEVLSYLGEIIEGALFRERR